MICSLATTLLLFVGGSVACLLYNSNDCRGFEVYSVPSDGIENYMTVGNGKNIPPQVPSWCYGLFYMDGNPCSDEVVSFANGVWSDADQAYFTKVYEENVWSWDDSVIGRASYDLVRNTGLTYRWSFSEDAVHIDGFLNLPFFFGDLSMIPMGQQFANLSMVRFADPNYFERVSTFSGKSVPKYRVYRIVDGDGNRTPYYESVYLANVNAGVVPAPEGYANATHLGVTQILAKVISQ